MAECSVGPWLMYWVCLDALIVLSGAVLTSYVGINGLMQRMSMDRCLPMFFAQKNPIRHTTHWIIIGFFGLTTSLYYIAYFQEKLEHHSSSDDTPLPDPKLWCPRGYSRFENKTLPETADTSILAGVYTIAFLSVMSLFAMGNMLLKYKRGKLARAVSASWPGAIFGLLGVLAGLIGTIIQTPVNVMYFMIYFGIAVVAVMVMFGRFKILKFLSWFTSKSKSPTMIRLTKWLQRTAVAFLTQPVIFFCKEPALHRLHKGVFYVKENENSAHVKIVHCFDPETVSEEELAQFRRNVAMIDELYPQIRVDLVLAEVCLPFSLPGPILPRNSATCW